MNVTDEYLASGFRDVDRTGVTETYSRCLSLLDSLPYYRQYKQKSYELLGLAPGQRVLDAGCGLGDDAFRMAERLLDGLVVGLDSSTKLVEMARSDERAAALRVEFCVGDLGAIPFDGGSFSRCRIDRVLQHVPDARGAVAELVRVLEPGGLLLAYDNDWGTFSVTSRYKESTRVVEDLWCDSFANGWIGRHLREYFLDAGLSSVEVHPSVSAISSLDTADQVYNLGQTVGRAVAAGHLSESEGAAWLNDLRERSLTHRFAASLTAYTVVGRKE